LLPAITVIISRCMTDPISLIN